MSHSVEKTVRLVNEQGLHMRPADLVVRMANSFSCQIQIGKGDQLADAKSILSILTLAAEQGTELRVAATGDDADKAVNALVDLIGNGFPQGDVQDGTQLAGEHE